MESLNYAMNNIILEDEEDEELVFGQEEGGENQQISCNAHLCLVGRFLTEGALDFQAMQQILAALWRPGKGVYIK